MCPNQACQCQGVTHPAKRPVTALQECRSKLRRVPEDSYVPNLDKPAGSLSECISYAAGALHLLAGCIHEALLGSMHVARPCIWTVQRFLHCPNRFKRKVLPALSWMHKVCDMTQHSPAAASTRPQQATGCAHGLPAGDATASSSLTWRPDLQIIGPHPSQAFGYTSR